MVTPAFATKVTNVQNVNLQPLSYLPSSVPLSEPQSSHQLPIQSMLAQQVMQCVATPWDKYLSRKCIKCPILLHRTVHLILRYKQPLQYQQCGRHRQMQLPAKLGCSQMNEIQCTGILFVFFLIGGSFLMDEVLHNCLFDCLCVVISLEIKLSG